MSGYLSPWYLSTNSSPTWTQLTPAGSRNWQEFDISNDRTKIIGNSGTIFISTDSGASFASKTVIGWNQDPKTRCKISNNGDIWYNWGRDSTSFQIKLFGSVDTGVTWAQIRVLHVSYSGAFDAPSDCTTNCYYISTGAANSGIYNVYSSPPPTLLINNTSEDSSATDAVAVSSDYTRVIAAGNNIVRVSSDSGNNFTSYTTAFFIKDMSSNDTGDQAIASLDGTNYLKESTDYGVTWTDNTAAGSKDWKGVLISDSGTIRLAWTASEIFRSTDSGATWIDITFSGASSISRCGLSGDGLTVISSNNPGYPQIINF